MSELHHHHDHDHPHHHPTRADNDAPLTYYQVMEIALRELLIERGIISADDVRRAVEAMDARTPAQGARVVARAWSDPAYKARLLANGSEAVRELGIDVGATRLIVVENTKQLHNLIVCTLCSCYPWPLLGLPPTWYKSPPYRARAVSEPRAVLREFGVELADEIEIRVWDSSAEVRYLVLPMRPPGTERLSEAELGALVTRDCMVGTALPSGPEVAAA